jgi:hypothetical protein
MSVVSLPHSWFEVVHQILFPPPPVVREEAYVVGCRVPVAPDLHPLDCAKPSNIAVGICPSMGVGPYDIDIEPVNQISSSYVSLELDGALDCREFVLDLDVFVVEDAFVSGISDSMRLSKTQI